MRTLGKMGQALSFDGINDYVTMGDVAALQFERTNSFSVSVWVKTTTATITPNAAITGKALSTAPYSGYGLVIRGDVVGDPYQFGLISDALGGNGVLVHVPRPVNTSWQHVVATYNGTSLASGVSVYVDGVLQSNTAIMDNLSSSILTSSHFNVGSIDNSNTFAFNSGSIDDVRIYNRVLTANEVKQLYNLAR
jgi:hypothetical protein